MVTYYDVQHRRQEVPQSIGISLNAYNYGKNFTYKDTPFFGGSINYDATVPFAKGFYGKADLDIGRISGFRVELGKEFKNEEDKYQPHKTKVFLAPYVAGSIYSNLVATKLPKDEQEAEAFKEFYNGVNKVEPTFRAEAVVGGKLNIYTPEANGPASNVTFGAEVGYSAEKALPNIVTGEVPYERSGLFGRTYIDGEVKLKDSPIKLGARLDVMTPLTKNQDFGYEITGRVAYEF